MFENKSIIPFLNYTPSRQAVDKFITSLRNAYGKDSKGQYRLPYEEAESYATKVLKTAKAPKRFDEDARVYLPKFYTAKSLASIKKLPSYTKKQTQEVTLGTGLAKDKEKIVNDTERINKLEAEVKKLKQSMKQMQDTMSKVLHLQLKYETKEKAGTPEKAARLKVSKAVKKVKKSRVKKSNNVF